MRHFCGRNHSTRDRRLLLDGESRSASGSFTLPPVVPVNRTAPGPSHEQIAALAYSYWEGRGRQGGSAEDDWFRAEQELRKR